MNDLLAITMIVKNEEKNLPKCLDGISPLINKPWCSLYITDTGSSDSTAEAARKYTKNVFEFRWQDDFSAARNYALDRINADWVMFIDSDNFMQDCTDIIRFFESGEYKKFGGASYTIRNLADRSGRVYTEQTALRLYKFGGNIRFAGRIHEYIPVGNISVKALGSVCIHTGNIRENGIAAEHALRNAKLLELEFKENRSIMLCCQLADAYAMAEDYFKARDYAAVGTALASDGTGTSLSVRLKLSALEYALGNYTESCAAADDYFSLKSQLGLHKFPDCEALYYKGMSLAEMKQYRSASEVLDGYFDFISDYNSAEYSDYSHETGCCDALSLRRAAMSAFYCRMHIGDFNGAAAALNKTSPAEWSSSRSYIAERFKAHLQLIERDSGHMADAAPTAEIIYKNYPEDMYEMLADTDEKLLNTLRSSDIFREYFSYCDKICTALKNGELCSENNSVCRISVLVRLYPDIVGIAVNYKNPSEDIFTLKNIYMICLAGAKKGSAEALKKFAEVGCEYFGRICTDEALENGIIPDDAKAAKELAAAYGSSAHEQAEHFKAAVRIMPSLAAAVKSEIAAMRTVGNNGAGSEMERLAIQIKSSAAAMIKSGRINEAESTLKQYLAMFPNDKEALKMLMEIKK